MSEFAGKSVAHEQEEQKLDTRAEVKRLTGLTVFVILVTVLAVLVAVAVYAQDKGPANAQDKYSLNRPAESRSPTLGAMRIGLPSLPPGKTKY